MKQLQSLGALDEEGLLTKLGRRMAVLPLDPPLSKMLLASANLGCSDEIVTIIAMLQAGNIFYRPRAKQSQADQKKAKFFQPEGDHLTLLTVYEAWKAKDFSKPWCSENFLQFRSLSRARDIRKQLLTVMGKYELEVVSAGRNVVMVRKAIIAGCFFRVARKDPKEGYRTLVDNQQVYIHPSSVLFQRQPAWVIYNELVMTTKEYMREVSAIEPMWLMEQVPRFFKAANPTKMSNGKRQEQLVHDHHSFVECQQHFSLHVFTEQVHDHLSFVECQKGLSAVTLRLPTAGFIYLTLHPSYVANHETLEGKMGVIKYSGDLPGSYY
ncbi:hypothetical protein ACFX2H_022990 [Malus domestica]